MAGFELDRGAGQAEHAHESQDSLAELLEARQKLSDRLADAINEGDSRQMIWLDGQIKNLSARIFATEISSLKKSIAANENRRAEVLEEIELLRRLKSAQNEKLQETLSHAQKLRADCGRTEVSLQFAENESHNLRASISNQSAKLEAIKIAKIAEVTRYE